VSVGHDVVVFGAHPDDAEMAMGGTIALLTASGVSLQIVSLTQGERGTHGTVATRRSEAAAAARVLGCDHRLLDFPDTRLTNDIETREALMRLIRAEQPKLVFAPYHTSRLGHHDGAAHVDHLATGAVIRDAVKLARIRGVEPTLPAHDVQRLFYYMVPRDQYPTFLVDVTAHMETLERALAAYETQMRIERQRHRILEILQTFRRYFGVAGGCEYAEPFMSEEPLVADAETLFRI
jgi:bacillithiol biosynthesis deacetylase BshB1